MFKTLSGKQITVQLKNGMEISGKLISVDQYLNIKLEDIKCDDTYPHLKALLNCIIRGNTVRYVKLKKAYVDCNLLQDASRMQLLE